MIKMDLEDVVKGVKWVANKGVPIIGAGALVISQLPMFHYNKDISATIQENEPIAGETTQSNGSEQNKLVELVDSSPPNHIFRTTENGGACSVEELPKYRLSNTSQPKKYNGPTRTLRIFNYDQEGFGAGVEIAPRLALTANHVVDGDETFIVSIGEEQYGKGIRRYLRIGEVVARDPELDLALLSLEILFEYSGDKQAEEFFGKRNNYMSNPVLIRGEVPLGETTTFKSLTRSYKRYKPKKVSIITVNDDKSKFFSREGITQSYSNVDEALNPGDSGAPGWYDDKYLAAILVQGITVEHFVNGQVVGPAKSPYIYAIKGERIADFLLDYCNDQKESIKVSPKAQEQLDESAARIPDKIRKMNPHMSWGIRDSKYNPKGMYKG